MSPKSYEALWKLYVPRDGTPQTVQGQLLRAYARIGHEVSINTFASWDARHESDLDLIARHLVAADDVARIRDLAATKASHADAGEILARLRALVVAWCNQKLTSGPSAG
jgi:hypothetical protein